MKKLLNKKVCILHPGNPKFDLRLKKTIKMLSAAGAEVFVLAYLSLPENDIQDWEGCTSLCRPRPYTNIKASENKVWLLRVAWNLTVVKVQSLLDRGVGCCGGLGKVAAELDVDWYHCINIETVEEIKALSKLTSKPIVYEAYEHFAALLAEDAYFEDASKNRSAFISEKEVVTKIASRSIVVGEEIAAEYAEIYGCPVPTVIHNVAPKHLLEPKDHHKSDDGLASCKFYFQSYLRPTYNIENVIEAFVATEGPSAQLTIQGHAFEPAYLDGLRRFIDSKVDSRITLLPACVAGDVVDVASNYDVGLISISARGTGKYDRSSELALPNKLFTYASAGLALAASGYPAQSRLINEYRCGVFFNPDDVEDISRAMQWCMDNPDEIKQMRLGAIQLGIAYSFENESERLVTMISDMLCEVSS